MGSPFLIAARRLWLVETSRCARRRMPRQARPRPLFFAAAPPTFAHVFSNYCEIATIGSRLQFVLREMSPLECE